MKKLLLLILTSLFPMMTFADESGTCGENLSWTYVESTKTLKISGSGKMNDYEWAKTPWFNYRFSITIIDIELGITSIGNYAFMGFQYLNSVTIPESVESIGESAFSGCSSLKEVTIPNSVTTLSSGIFSECSGLTSINIPNNITAIDSYAFYRCYGLTTITLPQKLTSIGARAFKDCTSINTVIVLSSPTFPLYGIGPFDGCSNIKEVTFDCYKVTALFKGITTLEKVQLSENVTIIEDNAFSGCSGLSSVELPNSLTSIESCAFYYCSNLSSIESRGRRK